MIIIMNKIKNTLSYSVGNCGKRNNTNLIKKFTLLHQASISNSFNQTDFEELTDYNDNNFKYKDKQNSQYGYNLVILSIVILIMGVIMTAVIGYYDISNVERRTKITEDKFKVINTALVSYLARNGRLPCPAPLDCDLEGCNNDNIYDEKILGLEFRKDKDIDKECISDNNGVFESKNDVGEKFLYGNIPAISLGLDNNYLIDDWGNKLVYIVPDILTQENALKDILINKETRDPNISDEYVKDGEIFVLLSNNTNTQGAYAFDNRTNNDYNKTVVQEVINEDGTTTKIEKEVNNLPEKDFIVDLNDEKYLKYHRNIDNLHDAFNAGNGGGVENPDCPPIELDYQIKVDNRECTTFGFKGRVQEYTIPENAQQIRIEVWAGGGGHTMGTRENTVEINSVGGKGGYSYGTLQIEGVDLEKAYGIKDRKLYVYVGEKGHNSKDIFEGEYDEDGNLITKADGQGGWNGGGSGDGATGKESDQKEGAGGGASDVRTARHPQYVTNWKETLSSRIIVAGGGAGSSKANEETHEDGGDGAGGIDISNGRGEMINGGYHVFGQEAQPTYAESAQPALGGGMTVYFGDNTNKPASCKVLGGGTLRGGGGYYAGGATICHTNYYHDDNPDKKVPDSIKYKLLQMSCAEYISGKTSYTINGKLYNNECGGGGGGSSYISKIFTNPGGQSGVRRSDGKVRICVVSKGGTVTHTMKFPQAKYGELSFADSICPYNIVNASTHIASISDYYTMSTFREIDGTIIDNRPAIKCGTAGQWETNTDGSIKMIYECKELPKCKQPFAVNNDIDWGDYDYEVTNTAIVHDIDGNNRMQCMVDKEGNANWYKVK